MTAATLPLRGERVTLRQVELRDLPHFYAAIYGTPNPEWKRWDAPYFPLKPTPYERFAEVWSRYAQGDDSRLVVEIDGALRGTVSRYWEDDAGVWLEVGIVIYDGAYWSRGYGSEALRLWTSHLFRTLSVPRVGLTTWSGNARMARAAQKLGFRLEGRIRKVRFWEGEYYDSLRFGVLREEWPD